MLKIVLKDFRAIKEAAIDLDGITVLAGCNGSGKSTVSKLTYHILYAASQYSRLLQEEYTEKLTRLSFGFQRSAEDLVFSLRRHFDFIIVDGILAREDGQSVTADKLIAKFEALLEVVNRLRRLGPTPPAVEIRLKRFVASISRWTGLEVEETQDFESVIQDLRNRVVDWEAKWHKETIDRPFRLLGRRLMNAFDSPMRESVFNVFEQEVGLCNFELKRVENPTVVNKVYYIDTPWVVDSEPYSLANMGSGMRNSHRFNLAYTLYLQRENPQFNEDFAGMEAVIGGRVSVPEGDYQRLIYRASSNAEYDLFHCATGIKSISIIQRLFHLGKLGSSTLLILDEPEAHLHPQWIVEYARIVVELNRKFGVRFLISSHSPDMIEALKELSDDGKGSNARFYLAENVDGRYVYNDQHGSINQIFAAFNKAQEKIEDYADALAGE